MGRVPCAAGWRGNRLAGGGVTWTYTDSQDRRHREFAIMSDAGGKEGDGGKVASVFAGFGAHFSWEEAERHAKLIAAAPDLKDAADGALTQLEQMEGMFEGDEELKAAMKALRAALAKAGA